MKKYLNANNFLFLGLVIFFLLNKAPIVSNNFKLEKKSLSNKSVQNIQTRETLTFPPPSRSIAIFWSTTCAPCKLEMKRLKSSVESGKISKNQIFAINPFEANDVITKFLEKSPYPFTFIDDPDTAFEVKVRATPTILFLDGVKVESANSGISLTGIFGAENFLKVR